MSIKERLEFLSVTCNGIEYRCEQWVEHKHDSHNEAYKKQQRSVWLSKAGEELDDNTAMKLLHEKSKDKEKQELLNRLWKEED